jgi:hypothetical protein
MTDLDPQVRERLEQLLPTDEDKCRMLSTLFSLTCSQMLLLAPMVDIQGELPPIFVKSVAVAIANCFAFYHLHPGSICHIPDARLLSEQDETLWDHRLKVVVEGIYKRLVESETI